MPDGGAIDFAAHIEAAARRLYGEPNTRLSTRRQLRFGSNGSLAVEIRGERRGTWYDHEAETGGGTLDLIRHKLGLVNGDALDWLGSVAEKPGRIVATYDYRDEAGAPLYQVCRLAPKDFRQRRPDGRGDWIWGLGGTRIVPYRLPELIASTGPVYIIEGEKDADALAALGLTATCNPMGAGKWRADFGPHFRGRVVYVIPDNDDAGRAHADRVAASLYPVADRVEILELPDLPPKGDVSDWLAAGGTAEELRRLAGFCGRLWEPGSGSSSSSSLGESCNISSAVNTSPNPPSIRPRRGGFDSVGADVILSSVYQPLRWTVPGYLPEGLSILAGRQKLGKTWLALDFALAVALGGSAMGGISCERGDVLYLDLENGERRIQRRLEMLLSDARNRPSLSRLRFSLVSPELGPEFISECEKWRQSVAKPALIVVDVLQRIKPAGRASRNAYENDYVALAELQQWATRSGVSVLVLHHTRKGGADDKLEALSGSNGLSACADTTLVLDRTAAGITLYVRGRDVEEQETALRFDAGRWSILGDAAEVKLSDERRAVLAALRDSAEPMSPSEIVTVTGMPGHNVRQLLGKMARAGELTKVTRGRYTPNIGHNGHNGHNQPEAEQSQRVERPPNVTGVSEAGHNGHNGHNQPEAVPKGAAPRVVTDVTGVSDAGHNAAPPARRKTELFQSLVFEASANVTDVTDVTGVSDAGHIPAGGTARVSAAAPRVVTDVTDVTGVSDDEPPRWVIEP